MTFWSGLLLGTFVTVAGRSLRQSIDLLLNDGQGSHPKGFPSYRETHQLLDRLVAYNPLFAARLTVGISWECRPIYAYWLSGARALRINKPDVKHLERVFISTILKEEREFLEDNCPDLLEGTGMAQVYSGANNTYAADLPLAALTKGSLGRGRVLMTSLHHAREPTSLTTGVYTFYKILRDLQVWYQGDEISKAVRKAIPSFMVRTEILYIPFVNPDGYVAIERTGNLMIRKNQRPTCSKHPDAKELKLNGVDLNRNYDSHWKQDHGKCDAEEYEGEYPFSEPETRAVRRVGEVFSPQMAINYHAYGDVWTRPWNCCKDKSLSPERARVFEEIHGVLNLTYFGSALELPILGYAATGEADDYLMEQFGIYSMSPEVGPDNGGFYPRPSIVRQLNEDNYIRAVNVVQFASVQLTANLTDSGQVIIHNHGLAPIGPIGIYLVTGPEITKSRQTSESSLALARHMQVYKSVLYKAATRKMSRTLRVPDITIQSRQTLNLSVDSEFVNENQAVEVCVQFRDLTHLKRGMLSPCQCGSAFVGEEAPLHFESHLPSDHPCRMGLENGRYLRLREQ